MKVPNQLIEDELFKQKLMQIKATQIITIGVTYKTINPL